ncbi:transposon Tf2-1 polyprotein isoform X1 [Cucumis melo var. makuwa]|uniref:Transposon Tf2-1 polyprotein isoform X1 n=1 Tax=Cucumis melo var. makuwa TaxID=1194695 RepID=A0A5D3E298_CUCMM|nr:transposon Tf2-1 polyprotein isoform X1 [Cucumis melo var. makuwa]
MVHLSGQMALPNFQQPFEIETDASGYSVGAVLIQSNRPIAYYSHTLALRDRARLIYERELMVVVLAVQRWGPYLLGTKLLGYSFEVIYKPGLENRAADALSRKPAEIQLFGLSMSMTVDVEIVKEEVTTDPKFQKIMAKLKESVDQQGSQYSLQNNMLKFKDRLVLTKNSTLIPVILNAYHDSAIGGHSGLLRTYKRIAGELFWEGMKSDIKKHCDECLICQTNKSLALSPAGLEIPKSIWSDISMDFVEGLPKVNGFDVILVVVDRLSEYGHFLPLKHPYTAKVVAELFVKDIVRLHGFPLSIVSDLEKVFLSHFWQELFRLSGTKLNKSTTYHPQSDGLSLTGASRRTYVRRSSTKKERHKVSYEGPKRSDFQGAKEKERRKEFARRGTKNLWRAKKSTIFIF